MAEEDEGAIGADWAEGAMGSEGVMGAEEDKGGAIYIIFNIRWLGHHGNRLYGCMGLQTKMLEWMEWRGWMDTP